MATLRCGRQRASELSSYAVNTPGLRCAFLSSGSTSVSQKPWPTSPPTSAPLKSMTDPEKLGGRSLKPDGAPLDSVFSVFVNPRNRITRDESTPLDPLTRARTVPATKPIHLASLRDQGSRPDYITPLGPKHSHVFLKAGDEPNASEASEQQLSEQGGSKSISKTKREDIKPSTFSVAARLGVVVRDIRLVHVAVAELESLVQDDRNLRFKMLVLGRKLLTMYAAELLHFRYPFLPTHVLSDVVNDLVGTENLVTLAMQLGVDVTLGINKMGAHEIYREPPKQQPEVKILSEQKWLKRLQQASYGARPDVFLKIRRQYDIQEDYLKRKLEAGPVLAPVPDPNRKQEVQEALTQGVECLVGALFMDQGPVGPRDFIRNSVLNREILISDYLDLEYPQRHLTALTKRLGMERPIGRILQETGRNSINPAFVVGVFSGTLLLGRGDGRSIKHAERRAAREALYTYYLNERKLELGLPSDQESNPEVKWGIPPVADTPPILT